jgi:predicted signal transduction protein with EAL and GGDEF domain
LNSRCCLRAGMRAARLIAETRNAVLARLPVDVLKIDRSFIREIVLDTADAVIVKSTFMMAHALGPKILL